MSDRFPVEHLLALATLRLDAGDVTRGTAFFVAPDYAVTAAHVVRGVTGGQIHLTGRIGTWTGQVEDIRPPVRAHPPSQDKPYPPPDVALIRVDQGPAHMCALLGNRRPASGTRVLARGHSRALGGPAVTAETESFTLTGELETPDPDCTLLKLGLGQAVEGMSGAPVLNISSGEVIGMLRTSRDVGANLGAWVVPAGLIRELWPAEVSFGNDRFHAQDERWRHASSRTADVAQQKPPVAPPMPEAGVSIGNIKGGGPVTVITGGNFGDLTIGTPPPNGRGHPRGGEDADGGRC